ncbi:hypothetical protein SARC_13640 [Sphaeroforma arctica JP610]|uniref:Uncharacterized protein n=1 Tax=Sphaeroforma arctica JP610 TaxID=667725 RepID=A0A0L0FCJ7_9EUKA|nr:hypothetical protein SARC_13640 [Sphaeroforma arctica JP610]KNC73803.1 hypothetical protein SARC_13640 [Sphaeroforma arctica JP610]|eukprot:XP_014147705.1 hypothetical protein SARC_13640 [Sphaeroforma arctica JP610]
MTTVYTVPEFNHTWTHHQAKSEEMRRMIPLYYCAIDRYPELEALKAAPHYAIKDRTLYGTTGVFFAHYGVSWDKTVQF